MECNGVKALEGLNPLSTPREENRARLFPSYEVNRVFFVILSMKNFHFVSAMGYGYGCKVQKLAKYPTNLFWWSKKDRNSAFLS